MWLLSETCNAVEKIQSSLQVIMETNTDQLMSVHVGIVVVDIFPVISRLFFFLVLSVVSNIFRPLSLVG